MTLRLKTPLGEADARKLRAGDSVLLTGVIYTARRRSSPISLLVMEKDSLC